MAKTKSYSCSKPLRSRGQNEVTQSKRQLHNCEYWFIQGSYEAKDFNVQGTVINVREMLRDLLYLSWGWRQNKPRDQLVFQMYSDFEILILWRCFTYPRWRKKIENKEGKRCPWVYLIAESSSSPFKLQYASKLRRTAKRRDHYQ